MLLFKGRFWFMEQKNTAAFTQIEVHSVGLRLLNGSEFSREIWSELTSVSTRIYGCYGRNLDFVLDYDEVAHRYLKVGQSATEPIHLMWQSAWYSQVRLESWNDSEALPFSISLMLVSCTMHVIVRLWRCGFDIWSKVRVPRIARYTHPGCQNSPQSTFLSRCGAFLTSTVAAFYLFATHSLWRAYFDFWSGKFG